MKRVIYIAGPMRGLPDLGRRAFMEAEEALRADGWTPINPARLPEDLPQECYMPICLAMLDQAETIGLLPGWENSAGAQIEIACGAETGKEVLYLGGAYTFGKPAEG